ncbi:MAG: TrbC/VirB2 family protein [Candidatus Nealsonbacteria bacterium DGGOD1a]|nr:MAG: TrbC/VirB2 family protein [Candidatus Nealsonbacteria bacterium DGGOD1a]
MGFQPKKAEPVPYGDVWQEKIMKPFYKIKYLFFRLTSFLLLSLFFGKAKAQDSSLYGVWVPPPSPAERIHEITNYLAGIAIIAMLIVIPILGFRWLVLKKQVNKKLLCALAIIIFIILEKILFFFVTNP